MRRGGRLPRDRRANWPRGVLRPVSASAMRPGATTPASGGDGTAARRKRPAPPPPPRDACGGSGVHVMGTGRAVEAPAIRGEKPRPRPAGYTPSLLLHSTRDQLVFAYHQRSSIGPNVQADYQSLKNETVKELE